jgi:alkyl hydroperoxide reductase subunit AhpC
MIGDPTQAISRNFGVLIEEEGLALRGTFVINPEGQIKVEEIHDLGIGRDAKELLRKVQGCTIRCKQSRSGLPCEMDSRRRNTDTIPGSGWQDLSNRRLALG